MSIFSNEGKKMEIYILISVITVSFAIPVNVIGSSFDPSGITKLELLWKQRPKFLWKQKSVYHIIQVYLCF